MADKQIEKVKCDAAPVENTRNRVVFRPHVDIVEKPDELLLMADVPGASVDDIDVQFERGELTIRANVKPRRSSEFHKVLQEYAIGDYERSFLIGEDVDAGHIEAQVANGVLTLHLPKAQAARPRKIAVKAT